MAASIEVSVCIPTRSSIPRSNSCRAIGASDSSDIPEWSAEISENEGNDDEEGLPLPVDLIRSADERGARLTEWIGEAVGDLSLVGEEGSPVLEDESASDGLQVPSAESSVVLADSSKVEFTGINHVAYCCADLDRSLEFYCGLLGLKVGEGRPKLPYRGEWLLMGAEGIHLMEVPNPDPMSNRPEHGGFDRHVCLNCKDVAQLRVVLEKAGIPYQVSMVPSIFLRDPDGNGLEIFQVQEPRL